MWITRWYIGFSAGVRETHLPPPLRDSPAVVEQRQSPLVAEGRGESGNMSKRLQLFGCLPFLEHNNTGTAMTWCTMLCEDTTGWVCACRE